MADRARVLSFWEGMLGLVATNRADGRTALGLAGDDRDLLLLEEAPQAPEPLPNATGLYHVALLLPDRAALGHALLALEAARARPFFVGAADHAVSEALYYADPEGNGLELYADRPRGTWRWVGRELQMRTDPLDLDDLRRSATGGVADAPVVPGTVVGHIHLRVARLERSGSFYRDRLGLEITVSRYPGALFLSWGGYHHHLALNMWGSRAPVPAPPGARGLIGWEVHSRSLAGAGFEGEGELVLTDPDGVRVRTVRDG